MLPDSITSELLAPFISWKKIEPIEDHSPYCLNIEGFSFSFKIQYFTLPDTIVGVGVLEDCWVFLETPVILLAI